MSFENKSVEEILKDYQTQENTTPENSSAPETILGDKPFQSFEGNMDEILNQKLQEEEKPIAEGEEESAPVIPSTTIQLSPDVINSIKLLIDSGKLSGFEDDKYETVDDLSALIEANKESWETTTRDQINETFYESKSPAWQAVMKYSEMVKSPQELIPFLEVVDDIEYINNLDLNDETHQEEIIRGAQSVKGLPKETIEQDIADYKARGILKDRAEILKPVLDNYNNARAQQIIADKQNEEYRKQQILEQHYATIEQEIINSPDIGGVKLKKEDRTIIASTLIPDNTGGLPIFTLIDNLFSTGRFDILSKIALLASNEQSFDNYYLSSSHQKVSEQLQRTLRNSNEKSFNSTQESTPQKQKANQNQQSFTLA